MEVDIVKPTNAPETRGFVAGGDAPSLGRLISSMFSRAGGRVILRNGGNEHTFDELVLSELIGSAEFVQRKIREEGRFSLGVVEQEIDTAIVLSNEVLSISDTYDAFAFVAPCTNREFLGFLGNTLTAILNSAPESLFDREDRSAYAQLAELAASLDSDRGR